MLFLWFVNTWGMGDSKVVKYFGGKSGSLLGWILSHFPERDVYVEAFGGSGALLFSQRTAVEVYNDIFENVYCLFKVLKDRVLFEDFKARCDFALYSEDMRREMKEMLKRDDLTAVERAFAYFYVNRTSVNGIGGFSVNMTVRRGMSKSVSDFLSAVDGLAAYHDRMSRVVVRNVDALELIEAYDEPNVFFYLDPPYHHSTRTDFRYERDMGDDGHERLIDVCLKSRAKILISGYDCEAYDRLVSAGWRKESLVVNTVSGSREKKQKAETVWFNYEPTQKNLFWAGEG